MLLSKKKGKFSYRTTMNFSTAAKETRRKWNKKSEGQLFQTTFSQTIHQGWKENKDILDI